MEHHVDYSLYLVTDRDLMSTPTLEEAVEQAIRGGVTLVQLREKHASSLEFYETAVRVKKITDSYNVPLIINDRVDIALAVDEWCACRANDRRPVSGSVGPTRLSGYLPHP